MNIETKFNINDLVQHKFQRSGWTEKTGVCFEVIEISCINCYTTAQVFYTCRPIHAVIEKKFSIKEETKPQIIDFGPGSKGEQEYLKFREDELKPCSDLLKEAIQKNAAE